MRSWPAPVVTYELGLLTAQQVRKNAPWPVHESSDARACYDRQHCARCAGDLEVASWR